MTKHELQQHRKRLKLSQSELATLLDLTPVTISRYERGVLPVPKTVALVVASMKPDPKKPPVRLGRPPKKA